MDIPQFDLSRAVARVGDEVEERWRRITARTAFVGGDEVSAFEHAFADFVGAPDCVGVANGTDALVIALRALDLRPGDEVIVPGFTFVATASAVVMAGGTPVFADVEPATLNLDPARAARALSDRTVGIIGVHLYGRPFDVDAMLDLAGARGLWLIEDAAQAHGAAWAGRPVGTFGTLATWSFYPAKNLGCFGDGGAVTGSDRELLARVRRLANHGRTAHYEHAEIGTNSRLDALQAAVLNVRLAGLGADNERRRELACRYYAGLGGIPELALLQEPDAARPVYHQLTVRTSRRDELQQFLAEQGIGSAVHYPLPLHLQPAFAAAENRGGALPVCEAAAREVLCLPMFPELTDAEVDRVCEATRRFFSRDRTPAPAGPGHKVSPRG